MENDISALISAKGMAKTTEAFLEAHENKDWIVQPDEFLFSEKFVDQKDYEEACEFWSNRLREISVEFYQRFMPKMKEEKVAEVFLALEPSGDVSFQEITDKLSQK